MNTQGFQLQELSTSGQKLPRRVCQWKKLFLFQGLAERKKNYRKTRPCGQRCILERLSRQIEGQPDKSTVRLTNRQIDSPEQKNTTYFDESVTDRRTDGQTLL